MAQLFQSRCELDGFAARKWAESSKMRRIPNVDGRLKQPLGATPRNKKLLGAKGIATRSKKLLGAPGIATRNKDATSSIATPLDPCRL